MPTLKDLIAASLPTVSDDIAALCRSADEFLLDVQNQIGHNQLHGAVVITGQPRTHHGGRDIIVDVQIHNLSCLQIHQLAQQRPHYLPLNRQRGEMIAFGSASSEYMLSLWATLIDDADTQEEAA